MPPKWRKILACPPPPPSRSPRARRGGWRQLLDRCPEYSRGLHTLLQIPRPRARTRSLTLNTRLSVHQLVGEWYSDLERIPSHAPATLGNTFGVHASQVVLLFWRDKSASLAQPCDHENHRQSFVLVGNVRLVPLSPGPGMY